MEDLSKSNVLTTDVKAVKQQHLLQYNLRGIETFEEMKLCVIPVNIEGDKDKKIFDLLIDTGAEITFLIQPIADLIGIEIQGSIKGQGTGGKSKLQQGIVKNLEIGNETEEKISLGACRVAIGKLPNKFLEYSIVGLLGAEAIQQLCLKIDYPYKYLELLKSL